MIKLYGWGTPNGLKIPIMLEELELPYRITRVDIGKGEQFTPDFLAVSPNNKIPAIVDEENGQALFESGAILTYLADAPATDRWLAAIEARPAVVRGLAAFD